VTINIQCRPTPTQWLGEAPGTGTVEVIGGEQGEVIGGESGEDVVGAEG
jgi:hypothetical protein